MILNAKAIDRIGHRCQRTIYYDDSAECGQCWHTATTTKSGIGQGTCLSRCYWPRQWQLVPDQCRCGRRRGSAQRVESGHNTKINVLYTRGRRK